VADGLQAATGLAVRLWWPNDVLVEGHKIAGILVEGVGLAPAVILGSGSTSGRGLDEWPPDLAGTSRGSPASART
jgi:BirA family transcriptional regulator, biotin operon repressor / biotin---[acetyl-CoA-carboxylase] ligase